jgi:diguanylate cyclase
MQTHDLAELGAILGDLMRDTRSMQLDMMRYYDETMHARRHADDAKSRMREIATELERVNTQLSRDPVTGVLNRRGLEEAMHREMSRAERQRTPLSLGVLSFDRLAHLREGHGQRVADDALTHVLGVATQALRPTDLVGRRGGDAFVILFSDTALTEAGLATQRLQGALSGNPFPHGDRRLSLTFSAGLAQLRSGDTQAALVARADRAVRRAQSRGANRVVAP